MDEQTKNQSVAGVDQLLSDSVGKRLQTIRHAYGLSQRELARRAEMTNSTLSMIEQGKVSPSISSLEKILLAFPMSLQEFFSESVTASLPVIRKDELLSMHKNGVSHRVLSIKQRDGELTYLINQEIPSGATIDAQWMLAKGFSGGIVVSGELELHLEGAMHLLEEGDAFQFTIEREHHFVNTSSKIAIVSCVLFVGVHTVES